MVPLGVPAIPPLQRLLHLRRPYTFRLIAAYNLTRVVQVYISVVVQWRRGLLVDGLSSSRGTVAFMRQVLLNGRHSLGENSVEPSCVAEILHSDSWSLVTSLG